MSQFRGSEIFELRNFRPASIDDIATVHAKAYVSGLEKVISPSFFLVIFLVCDLKSEYLSYGCLAILSLTGYGSGLGPGSYSH